MKVTITALPEVLILEPRVFADERGLFFESFNQRTFHEVTGSNARFVQDNHSASMRGVLRGIHYQVGRPQGKLVRVTAGALLDVAVDLRRSSPRFGQWTSVELSAQNCRQVWIPPGFGHAFVALSERTEVLYKTTDYWVPQLERAIAWNDPTLAIAWGLHERPRLSPKDEAAPPFESAEVFD